MARDPQRSLAFKQARTRREVGIVSSILHAEHDRRGWADRAFMAMMRFAAIETRAWTVEQFREWAEPHGLDRPPDLRAFGGITQKALHHNVIKRVGYAPAHSSNGSRKPLYFRPIN